MALSGPTQLDPIRVKFTAAMQMLAVSRPTLDRLVARDVFTALYPNGTRGRGKRVFLLYAEVKVYGEQGEDALREYRAKQQRQAAPKAGRK